MIPTIKEILTGLLNGSFDIDRCEAWIHTHMELFAENGDLRDQFAAKALQAVPMPQCDLHDIQAAYDRIARHAYKMADAMLAARGEL